jgi:hypothetical protein
MKKFVAEKIRFLGQKIREYSLRSTEFILSVAEGSVHAWRVAFDVNAQTQKRAI